MPAPDQPDQPDHADHPSGHDDHDDHDDHDAGEPTQAAGTPIRESVRRLLAEARHTEPLPPEVAERLDGLLGELVEARSARDGVHSLDARRRRRRGLLLVAAAAAVVIGIGVPTVRGSGGIGLGGDDSASDSAGSAASSADRSTGSSASSAAGAQAAPVPPGAEVGEPVVLTASGFEDQVRRAGPASTAPVIPSQGAGAYESQLTLSFLPEACGDIDLFGDGELLPASYDGEPAVLAYRPASGAEQRVDLLACGTADVIRTTTIPAP